ncbi:MAG: diguanylate cyclase [Candidatus Omnitrophica bacterium]|nr:diguanylate cyclase [Candidatus Omnitrophota bacterium]
MKNVLRVLIVTGDKDLKTALKSSSDGWEHEVFFADLHGSDIDGIIKFSPDVVVIDVQHDAGPGLEVCDLLKNDFMTAYIPVIILVDRRHLRRKLLKLKQGVDDYLIKPPDLLELRIRIEMAAKRSQNSFYASPLTGLPGSIIIEEMLEEKIKNDDTFVVGHVDIDNFKSFNDKYGYLKGDMVIMQTAYMLSTSVKRWGNKTDFTGHIGGDDFVFISTPDKYMDICQNFVCMFDMVMPFYYSGGDRRRKCVMSRNRLNRFEKTPLMSVTLALVMKNNPHEFNSIIELNEKMAEVKQYLKKIPGSKYMADRRIFKKDDHLTLRVFSNDESLVRDYKPLGQILVEENIVTLGELDNALRMHWKRGVLLGEALKDRGSISDERLNAALSLQENKLGSR